ncbi:MAG: hypothetical protein EDM05_014720 [Leptolyngbya sp. IPPAS B-1204]|nr:hypothetical protein [Elainella sp. C42_A2020_010]RNJ67990.1 MAG: hypothetical protein EDM05_16130 [Leptolyngbya sp. IPPAS B-1204]
MDISGTWLGTYWQNGLPTRFEATFVQSGNSLSGSMLDDNYLGEAQLSGEVVGRSIRFTKRYLTSSPNPVDYSGTIAEDANSMSGNWRIGWLYSGKWEAHRSNQDLMADLKNRLEQKVPATANTP